MQLASHASPDASTADSAAAPDASATDRDTAVHVSGRRQLTQLAAPRIVGGTQTNAVRYPYIASLRNSAGQHFCGGSLVAPRVVLTAAHCVYDAGVRTPTVRRAGAGPGGSTRWLLQVSFEAPWDNVPSTGFQASWPLAAAIAAQVHIGRSYTAAAESGFDARRTVAAVLHPQYSPAASANDVSASLRL